MKISIKRDDILDLQISLKKEYLLTNGKGGYCSSSILDCHTRKYHGLLVLPLEKQKKVYNLLSKLEVNAIINKKEFHLSTNKFPNVYHHTGHKYVDAFEMDDYPVTTYKIGDTIIKKSILMPYGEETVLVRYDVEKSERPIVFQATPFLAYREMHELAHENMDIQPRTFFEKNGFKIQPYTNLPAVFVQSSLKSVFYPSPNWWTNFEYLKERNRGYDYQEDLFVPGLFELKIKEGQSVIFRASTKATEKTIRSEWDKEVRRLKKYNESFAEEKKELLSLKKHAGHFLYKDLNKNPGIIAGYHWFREWTRDTMISFAGITLARGDHKNALGILKKYAKLGQRDYLPNFLSDDGNHAYNAIDASLLYFRAVQQYMEYTDDRDSVKRHILPALIRIIKAVKDNKVPTVYIDDRSFLFSGNENTALTWMDAMVDGKPVTSRHGAPVEVNALWYNALKLLHDDFGKDIKADFKKSIKQDIENFETHFVNEFWNAEDNCFYDVIRHDGYKDGSIRPNQLFATAVKYTVVPEDKAKIILETIKQHLLTAYGLRTLSPRNNHYRGEYKGDQRIRDFAYHQGMVWPWTLGIYVDSLLKYQKKSEVKKFVKQNFVKLWDKHASQYGLFQISELFRPNPPQVAKGCMAQAWSVAEVVRVLDMLK